MIEPDPKARGGARTSDDGGAFDPGIAAVLDAVAARAEADRQLAESASALAVADADDSDPSLPITIHDPDAEKHGRAFLTTSEVPERTADFQAIMQRSVLDEIRAHGESAPDHEVCGVLVGSVYENPSAAFVYIDAAIRGDGAAGRSTQVTFTAETWQHVDKVMEEKHPGKRIVGWYHTHPGFGIFLSDMDLFIQKHFFSAPWQTAFVFDPLTGERGLFAWRGGETKRVEFVVDDNLAASSPEDVQALLLARPQEARFKEEVVAVTEPGCPPGTITDLAERVRVLEQRQRWMTVGFALMVLAAVAWPLIILVAVLPGAGSTAAPVAPAGQSPNAAPGDPSGAGAKGEVRVNPVAER